MNKTTQQTLALAGVAQSAFLVHQLGQYGVVAQDKLDTMLSSLFKFNPQSTEEVYGDVRNLKLGLQVMQDFFQQSSSTMKSPEIIRYMLALIHLESKFSSKKKKMDALRNGLDVIVNHNLNEEGKLDFTDPALHAQISGVYQQVVSTLSYRIQVKGKMEILQKDKTADRVRAVLMAGLRSAFLWRQLGGRRWQLLFNRKRISYEVNQLLKSCQ